MFSAGFRNRCSVGVLAGVMALGFAVVGLAQEKDAKGSEASQTDPLKRRLPEKQRKANAKALKIELSKTYRKWLDEDVRWIITDEEKSAFMQLSNDEERDQFIEAFWQRRDPTPDTEENEFKEEHYRRIAYANEHFPAGIPGWTTPPEITSSCTAQRLPSVRAPPTVGERPVERAVDARRGPGVLGGQRLELGSPDGRPELAPDARSAAGR